jgi:hypothetical protein
MKMIKNWNQYLEAVNGNELIMPHTPNMPDLELRPTLSKSQTEVLSDKEGNFYTYDDFQNLHQDFLKAGGKGLEDFTKENLDSILDFFKR